MGFTRRFLICTLICAVSSTSFNDLDVLKATLFADYNPHTPPVVNRSLNPLNVTAFIDFSKVAELDEADETLVTWFDLYLEWTDERLMWNTSDGNPDVEMMIIPVHKVWSPRLQVHQSVDREDEKYEGRQEDYVQVYSSGLISWYHRVRTKTLCRLDISKFPLDKQSCNVTLTMKNAAVDEASIGELNWTISNHCENGEWNLTNLTSAPIGADEILFNGNGIQLVYSLERKSSYYLLYVIFPAIFLILTNPCVLLISDTNGERVSVSVTMLISLTIFMTQLSYMIPNTSSGMPVVAMYLYFSYMISCWIVVLAIILNTIYMDRLLDMISKCTGRRCVQDKNWLTVYLCLIFYVQNVISYYVLVFFWFI